MNTDNIITYVNLFFLSTIFLLGVIGNIVALHVFLHKLKRKPDSRFEFLLSCLAVVDLLSTFFSPGLLIYLTAVEWRQWHFGDVACKTLRSLPSFFITLSQCILMLISFQRYRVVSKPLRRPLSNYFIAVWFVASSVVSVALTIPWLLTLEILTNKKVGLNTCTSTSQTTSKTGFILNFTFDGLMLARDLFSCAYIFTYGRMTVNALQDNKEFFSAHPHIIQRTKNAKKLLYSITLVCCSCIIPIDLYHCVYFALRAADVELTQETYTYLRFVLTILKTLQAAQSSVNPLIYSRRIKDFRLALFCQKIHRSSSRQSVRSRGGGIGSTTQIIENKNTKQ